MRPYFELIRIYLVPTALADSWAGFFISGFVTVAVNGGAAYDVSSSPTRLALLALLSATAYAFGMVTNDLFDVEKDAKTGASRPLVVGDVSPRAAMGLAIALGIAALVTGYLLGTLGLTLGLIVTVLAYNAGGKRIPVLGSVLMGSCRSLNLLVGAATAVPVSAWDLVSTVILLVPAIALGGYVVQVTSISLLEDHPYNQNRLRIWTATLLALPISLAIGAMVVTDGLSVGEVWLDAAIFAAYLVPCLQLPREEDLSPNASHPAAGVVRRALGGIYFLDAGLLFFIAEREAALGVYVLFVLGWILKRWWLKSAS